MLKHSRAVAAARKQHLAARAWEMRRAPTFSELALWQALRGNRLGIPFRRQVVLGSRYIADFAAPSIRLVVEVDGEYHARRAAADARRDRNLERLGFRVLRIPAALVTRNRAADISLVRDAIARRAR